MVVRGIMYGISQLIMHLILLQTMQNISLFARIVVTSADITV